MYLHDSRLIVCRFAIMSHYLYSMVTVSVHHDHRHQQQKMQNVYNYYNRTVSSRHRRRLLVYTPDTYPLPGSPYCAHDYLKLWYVCDPHLWLGQTDASKLNKSLNPKKFSQCSSVENDIHSMKKLSSTSPKVYSMGLALASSIQVSDSDNCVSGNIETRRVDVNIYENYIKNTLRDIARKLRRRWYSQTPNGCASDILILFVRSVIMCVNNHLVTFHSERNPMMAVSFSTRVLASLSESSAMGLEKSTFQMYNDHQNSNLATGSALNSILKIFSILDAALPSPSNNSRSDSSQESDHHYQQQQQSKLTAALFPKHTIPTWALIAFVVSVGLTLICAIIGHWVNTSGSRSKFYSADRFPFARAIQGSRRWRAGFAGGMMELHNSAQTQSTGRSFSVGVKPGGMGRAKSKMFGAMSMGSGNKRSNFNPQYNYQRV